MAAPMYATPSNSKRGPAKFKPCNVEGCRDNAHYSASGSRGWCNKHYQRWRKHGDPLAGQTFWGAPNDFLTKAMATQTNECILWPYGLDGNGYVLVCVDGAQVRANRLICEKVQGPAPSSKHEAAHLCGHSNCINHNHLAWKTHIENEADKLIHGTRQRGEQIVQSKLTESDVRKIRSLKGAVPQRVIGEMFGVGQQAVSAILLGKKWAWLQD